MQNLSLIEISTRCSEIAPHPTRISYDACVSTRADTESPAPTVPKRLSAARTVGAWALVAGLTALTASTLPIDSLVSKPEQEPRANIVLVAKANQPILASSIDLSLITVLGDGNGTSELTVAIWDSSEGNNITGLSIYLSKDLGSAFDQCEVHTTNNSKVSMVDVGHGLNGLQLEVPSERLMVSNEVPPDQQDYSKIAASVAGTSTINCYTDDTILQHPTDAGALVLSPTIEIQSDAKCSEETTLRAALEIRTDADAHLSHSSFDSQSASSGEIRFPQESALASGSAGTCQGYIAGGYAAINLDDAARFEALKSLVAGLAIAWLLSALFMAVRFSRHYIRNYLSPASQANEMPDIPVKSGD